MSVTTGTGAHLGVTKGARQTKLNVARQLRRKATESEAAAWELLRDRRMLGLKFRRQQVVCGFVVDFYCADLRLALELDGSVHEQAEVADYDRRRDDAIRRAGLTVLRLRNEDVDSARLAALLSRHAASRCPVPLPIGRGTDLRSKSG